ncbi:extracellular metallo proteinase MEP [Sporormia fimetaria CBS 119925]|uniref:Extracellular metalloproteinase n=1 Tax=Sporormia fimetaria CBS 119925 TaxID=1340428 RepID=A0A6A6VE42_9PLEO|nr:extracellular metallo proteinase MEP [Sporormia fimetaria CBS 119925]
MRGSLLGALALALPFVHAHPTANPSRSLGVRRRAVVDLEQFRPKIVADFVANADIVPEDDAGLVERTPVEKATDKVKLTVMGATFRLVESYESSNGMTHVYFKQTANGIDIDNGDFNVNVKNGDIFSFGNSFYTGKIPEKLDLTKREQEDPAEAVKGAVNVLQLPIEADSATAVPKQGKKDTYAIKNTSGAEKEPEAKLVYFQKDDGTLALTWRVETDILDNWLLSYVDAKDPSTVHGVIDYAQDATYEVYPWGINDPSEGSRVVVRDPWLVQASEFGWHSDGGANYTTTRGNNGIAQSNHANSADYLNQPRPISETLDFRYPFSTNDTDWKGYANASITQLFYTANKFHDLMYLMGFNERAGNFEFNNNGARGLGADFVILNTQDGSGLNNANFATPPDGTPGRMRMYMWDTATPWRDSSFEAGVVIHEYAHGVSNRLTGGPQNSQCLGLLESGGMGEGWGDFLATAIRLKNQDNRNTNYPMGAWVNNDPRGIRAYPYSTDVSVNPHVYTDANALTRVHAIGTIWATMLYEVMWNLIDKWGKNDRDVPTFDQDGVPTDGKYLAIKLVVDAMKLQPCNPTFISARDAILDADKDLTNGANVCQIWRAFAKRGLGRDAKYAQTARIASYEIPAGVC